MAGGTAENRPTDGSATLDPAALIRSRDYRRLLVFAAVIGVVVSAACWAFLEAIHAIQQLVFDDLPDALGFERGVSIDVPRGKEIVHLVNSGVPHAIIVEKDWDSLGDAQVETRGRAIRYHEKFAPAGVNADFVRVNADGRAAIRTYERGVEAETLACGTGAVASAVVLAHLGLAAIPVELVTRGGDVLRVSFKKTADGAADVVLEGPAAVNFEGWVNLDE